MPHRENGPAELWDDGYINWMQYGKPHREDGPAYISEHDTETQKSYRYYLRGIKYNKEAYEFKIRSNIVY